MIFRYPTSANDEHAAIKSLHSSFQHYDNAGTSWQCDRLCGIKPQALAPRPTAKHGQWPSSPPPPGPTANHVWPAPRRRLHKSPKRRSQQAETSKSHGISGYSTQTSDKKAKRFAKQLPFHAMITYHSVIICLCFFCFLFALESKLLKRRS